MHLEIYFSRSICDYLYFHIFVLFWKYFFFSSDFFSSIVSSIANWQINNIKFIDNSNDCEFWCLFVYWFNMILCALVVVLSLFQRLKTKMQQRQRLRIEKNEKRGRINHHTERFFLFVKCKVNIFPKIMIDSWKSAFESILVSAFFV